MSGPAACDNGPERGLGAPARICRACHTRPVKFTRRTAPGCMERLSLLVALRAAGCVRCRRVDTVVGHGHLQGDSCSGPRGLRLLCSDRYSNCGCGRTFSVHWDDVIPGASLAAAQLLMLIRALAAAPSRHAAWSATRLSISLTGAYRWFARWARFTISIKTWLCTVCHPPGKSDALPDPHNLRHLDAAFSACPCPAAAFQNRFQVALAT